jgi:hypothetical protein
VQKSSVRQKFRRGKRIRVFLKKYLKCGNGFRTEKWEVAKESLTRTQGTTTSWQ